MLIQYLHYIINFVKMRYQSRTYRSQSYLNNLNKQNKQNQNIINIKPNKPLKQKPLQNLFPKLDKKISQATTDLSVNSPLLKQQDFSLYIKRTYSEHTGAHYAQDIVSHLCSQSSHSEAFLESHTITATLRSKMVDWMIQVLSSYKMTEDSFFRSVKIMDNFLKKSPHPQEIKDLHLIGITSMFSACKYEQIYPIKLETMYDRIARKKFRRSQILQKESEIIAALNFRLQDVNIFDLIKSVTHQIQLQVTPCKKQYLNQIILYLSKMVLFSYELSQVQTKVLAAAVYFIALKTLEQVEPNLTPEIKLPAISAILNVSEQQLIEISRKVLQLAKNFSKEFPMLSNLKKFNKFEYKKEEN